MWKSSLILLLTVGAQAAQVWTVRVEEPTGLYRRTNEVAVVALSKVGGAASGYTVTDAGGRELPWQVGHGQLLFPASLIPGELPAYKVVCCDAKARVEFATSILLRRLGLNRVEFGNVFFRAVIDLKAAAIVEAYTLRAGPQRSLNLVETTPEGGEALKGDVHETTPDAERFSPPPVAGVTGQNTGWTTLGGQGGFTGVDLVEAGPLRGRLRLTRPGETWEITWTSGNAWFRWKASKGFRFAAISASPYVPFDRCKDGSEYDFPTGPGEEEPQPRDVGPRNWPTLPGGHMVYYQGAENYGALGIVALDGALRWTGAGTRRFEARKSEGTAEIAVTFPEWQGSMTAVSARKENRMLRQPLLVQVSGPAAGGAVVKEPAERMVAARVGTGAATAFHAETVELDGEWSMGFAEKGEGPPTQGWRTVKVPGTAHVQWLESSKIYTREAEWISLKEWWYRRSFTVPETFQGKRLRLQFEATDYYADTYLNGVWVGRHEGYIDPYEFDVTEQAKPGANEVMVRVWTPVDYYWKHRPYTVKGAYGAVDQKPDDITPLGITRSVRLVASTEAQIRDVAVDTRLKGAAAEVRVELEATGAERGFTWELTLSPRNFASGDRVQVKAAAGARQTLTIPVEHPQLWWTRDHGQPNLYTLDVRLVDASGRAVDGQSLAVGLREIEKIGWDFYLNGKRMFIRGTNYYDSLYMAEMDRAKYERDMKLMLGMNINMIRLHCHFSNREFYDLADEQGVLIWQDFLEAWYPHDRGFAQRAAMLYDNHVRYARNHPSVAIWATSDEEDFENYREITKHLYPRASMLDPQRRAVIRSTGRFGDSHVYHGWYNGTLWEYTQMTEQFVSELGATSLPNYETLIQFMPNEWPIKDHEEEWVWRRLQIPQAMKAWGDPDGLTLKEYVPQTQAYVARLFQIALERMRRRKHEGAGGILHFHAIDIWPSVTMAAIDINRVPTKVYDTVRRSFEPVAALFEYDRDKWKPGETVRCGLWAVNDRWTAVPGAKLRWRFEGQRGEYPVSLAADGVLKVGAAEFAAPRKPGPYALRAEMVDAGGQVISENVFEFTVAP
ncbi:sugar-binding domain-containing protein [uncultured Paludibaculum sp.]|uniref:beta-mannosidase n=1 Tax=uncultured Paludibaculum sp. TaxID=1765020 RepID=UPI002AAA6713|nr:sugar-binding domain-containing protein [uncultured Paludibaculum sp.]